MKQRCSPRPSRSTGSCPFSYELSVVIPIMAVLSAASVWVLGTDLIGASYAIRLCGKVIILGVITLLGRPWFPAVRAVVFRWRPGVA